LLTKQQDFIKSNNTGQLKVIQKQLKIMGFKDLIIKTLIPEIKPQKVKKFKKTPTQRVPKAKRPKYQHKQIKVHPQALTSTEILLSENDKLIIQLQTFTINDLGIALKTYERYKFIQICLQKRNVDYNKFQLTTGSYGRIMHLLGNKCSKCGTQYKLTLHHIVPKCESFDNSINNLKILCRHCHDAEHDMIKNNYILIILECGI